MKKNVVIAYCISLVSYLSISYIIFWNPESDWRLPVYAVWILSVSIVGSMVNEKISWSERSTKYKVVFVLAFLFAISMGVILVAYGEDSIQFKATLFVAFGLVGCLYINYGQKIYKIFKSETEYEKEKF